MGNYWASGYSIKFLRLAIGSYSGEDTVAWMAPISWLRLAKNGADIVAYVSADGKTWTMHGSYPQAAWLAGNPDRIGFGLLYNRSGTAGYRGCIGSISYWDFQQ